MTQITAENMEDLVPPPAEPAKVDEGQVRRKSMMDGAWKGIKRGLFWGGIGGLGMGAVGGAVSLFFVKTAVTASPGLIAGAVSMLTSMVAYGSKVPHPLGKVAALVGGAGLATLGFFGIKAVAAGAAAAAAPGAAAMSAIGLVASTVLPIVLPVIAVSLLAGAVIGGIAGAVSGYMESDTKVEQEHRKAKQVAAQLNFERQQVMKQIMQEREMERQLAAQTSELHSGLESGQLHSPATPARGSNDKNMQAVQNGM